MWLRDGENVTGFIGRSGGVTRLFRDERRRRIGREIVRGRSPDPRRRSKPTLRRSCRRVASGAVSAFAAPMERSAPPASGRSSTATSAPKRRRPPASGRAVAPLSGAPITSHRVRRISPRRCRSRSPARRRRARSGCAAHFDAGEGASVPIHRERDRSGGDPTRRSRDLSRRALFRPPAFSMCEPSRRDGPPPRSQAQGCSVRKWRSAM